ncbi:MAG: DUF4838 domain-containing protein [Oscillospiraceae bacterium]|nr:DUF4838 domain-containing protein [Oscillospiraceae bacterium]
MFKIKKLRADHVFDFAAEELKKYLRMMMPEGGDVEISYEPGAEDGFRLGLLEDFGLPFEGDDAVLDDVIHVEADAEGGILAGSNPRSVLFSVYRFLRENGCRWLYPGVDGDYVPMKDLEPVSYHKLADHRFRGHCNEGAESQQCMLETIDFYAKQELNIYMLEFKIPFGYYDHYYNHRFNNKNRIPEPVSPMQVLQWKRQCETEIAKRGLQFHDMGHGWTADPYGMDTSNRKLWRNGTLKLTDECRKYIALRNGERELFRSDPQWTNPCMSQPIVRSIMADAVVAYAKSHSNVDYLHVWLADGTHNHCECEECSKMRPSDWYMMIMNEIDEKLEKEGLDTRIVFIAYVDTLWGPEKIAIKNPKRFSLLYAPITRTYCESFQKDSVLPEPLPYERNAWQTPSSALENQALLNHWFEMWKGDNFAYEYHFWRHQVRDPGGQYIAKRIYEDIRALKYMNLRGIVEDGSQRSFFPNGFAIYIYAETLMNRDCDYEAVKEDYFSHIYGPDWKLAVSLLSRITAAFDYEYTSAQKYTDPEISKFYNPDMVPQLRKIKDLAAEERALVAKHMVMPNRPQTVSWRLLGYHATYIELFADLLIAKAAGDNFLAKELHDRFREEFGKFEVEIERYYDQSNTFWAMNDYIKNIKHIVLE